ncbi:hypothetical protein ES703_124228 [subsurface metagenome]
MGLSPEEKRKIYEEEKARIEAQEQIEREKQTKQESTSTGLQPNVAGLLCYIGGWISGIIFLVLEQKNRWVRFHAVQSIVVFGTIMVAGIILGWIPVVGGAFSWIISVIGFILWIILMIKAYNGERYKLPVAGDIAERIAGISADEYTQPPTPPPAEPPLPSSRAGLDKYIGERIAHYFKSKRVGRITESSFAIAWSIVLLVFFNFFHQYIAYYSSEKVGGVTTWTSQPFFTEDINLWLPILTTTLILTIIGHIILIIFDRYTLREIVFIILNAFGLATVLTLLSVYPFDFSVIPNAAIADATYVGVRVLLIFISIVIGIVIIVSFIKLIIHTVKQSTSY